MPSCDILSQVISVSMENIMPSCDILSRVISVSTADHTLLCRSIMSYLVSALNVMHHVTYCHL